MSRNNTLVLASRKLLLVAVSCLVLFIGVHRTALAACSSYAGGAGALGIPTWYKYLPDDSATTSAAGRCVPQVRGVGDFLLIVLALIEIMLRIATYVAIIMFIYGAIRMIISQGSVDEVRKSRETLVNAVVGLVICLVATGVVNFVGRSLG